MPTTVLLSTLVYTTSSSVRWLHRARARTGTLSSACLSPRAAVVEGLCARKAAKPTASRLWALWLTCFILDYGLTALGIGTGIAFMSGDKFNPVTAIKIHCMMLIVRYAGEILKAYLFSDILAPAKVDHLSRQWREFSELFSWKGVCTIASFLGRLLSGEGILWCFRDRAEERRGVLFMLFYIIKIGFLFIPAVTYMQVQMGDVTFPPLMDKIPIGSIVVPRFALVYLEWFVLNMVKDYISMSILHELMHTIPWLYKNLHKTHHLPGKEINALNLAYFDVMDIVIENAVAPLMMQTCYRLCGLPPHVHWVTVFLLGVVDFQIHSVSPYTVCFSNPILDYVMNANIAHNLHHALHNSHHRVWPLHQLGLGENPDPEDKRKNGKASRGSKNKDMAYYNRVFGTQFPC